MSQDTLHLRHMDITLSEIARLSNTDVDALRYLNPELQREHVPYSSQDYVLRVPPRVATYFATYHRSLRAEYGKRRNSTPPATAVASAAARTTSNARSTTSYSPLLAPKYTITPYNREMW